MKTKLCILFLLLLAPLVFGQNLVDTYVENAEKQLILKNYEKAYSYINFALKYYSATETPSDTKVLAEKIYFSYLSDLLLQEKFDPVEGIQVNTLQYPVVASTRVNSLIQQINARKAGIAEEKKRKEEQARLEAEMEARRQEQLEAERKFQEELNKILEQQRKIEAEKAQMQKAERDQYERRQEELRKEQNLLLAKQQEEMNRALQEQRELELKKDELERQAQTELLKKEAELKQERDLLLVKQQENLNRILETTIVQKDQAANTNVRMSQNIIILIAVIGVFLFIGFGLLIFISIRNSQKQQQSFENTLNYMQTVRNSAPSQNITLSLPGIAPDVGFDASRMIADTRQHALPAPEDLDMDRLKNILEQCYTYGLEIDKATNRKNASKNTAELVFKISEQLGYNKIEAMLFFAVGFIHDIGFLNIDPVLLQKEQVTEEEFQVLKTHTKTGLNLIHFVDHDLKQVFIDGISKHHENLDGTGYPGGLTESDIPYVARVIRVVETFLSLTTKRNYKDITDQETAIEELRKNTDKYDEKIIDVLEIII